MVKDLQQTSKMQLDTEQVATSIYLVNVLTQTSLTLNASYFLNLNQHVQYVPH